MTYISAFRATQKYEIMLNLSIFLHIFSMVRSRALKVKITGRRKSCI